MTRKATYSLVSLILGTLGLFFALQACRSASEAPTSEFLSAALASQLESASIDVTYDYNLDGDLATVAHSRYFRTPKIQYISKTHENGLDFAWFDRAARVLRLSGDDRGVKKGLVSNTKSKTGLALATLPDPILYNLPAGELRDLIGKGTVSDKMETIDGQACWRVDIVVTEKPYGGDHYILWVDPDVGFCPRRIEAHWPNDTVCIAASFSNYSDIGSQVWFPMNIKWTIAHPGEADSVGVATVLSAKIVPESSALQLDTSFTSGTEVNDQILDATYTVP